MRLAAKWPTDCLALEGGADGAKRAPGALTGREVEGKRSCDRLGQSRITRGRAAPRRGLETVSKGEQLIADPALLGIAPVQRPGQSAWPELFDECLDISPAARSSRGRDQRLHAIGNLRVSR